MLMPLLPQIFSFHFTLGFFLFLWYIFFIHVFVLF